STEGASRMQVTQYGAQNQSMTARLVNPRMSIEPPPMSGADQSMASGGGADGGVAGSAMVGSAVPSGVGRTVPVVAGGA
ncbi:MAG: hypothetical protein ACO35E_11925, partial [Ilumatobacteraceae bacterium]